MSDRPHDDLLRQDSPPKFEMVTPIRILKAGEVITCVLVSPKPQGYYGHFQKGKTNICTKHLGLCPWCGTVEIPRKWWGFLFCVCSNYREQFFIEITNRARDEISELLGEPGSWQGNVLQMQRRTKNDKSPVVYTAISARYMNKPLPEEKSVLPTLRRRWRFES